jgi:hypothetical protein
MQMRMEWRSGSVQPNLHQPSMHRTVRWCTGQCPVHRLVQQWSHCSRESTRATWLKITALSASAPDYPVSHQRPCSALGDELRRSREFTDGATAKIHWIVRCAPDCLVSQRRPRPTVGSAINGRHVARANGHLVAPDCLVCQGDRGRNGRSR